MSTNDHDTARFWRGCEQGRFMLQQCADGGHLQYPPGPLCRHCGSALAGWVDASRDGRVEAFSLVTRAPVPAFAAHVPYMVAVVRLGEGPIVETWLTAQGRTPAIDEVAIGRPVRIEFQPVDGKVLPIAALQPESAP
jgi:uncharacterized OB-fold protein